MITCKMTYVIQGILFLHSFYGVNLSNYGLPYVCKSVIFQCAFTHILHSPIALCR
jgi:hypothetical protein